MDGSTDERNAAARALRRLKDPRGLMALLQALHRCAWICTAGREYEAPLLRAIRAFGSSAVPGLVAMLADESDERREDAARILGELGDRRAVIRLIDLLYDHHPGVAIAALEALCNLGDPRAAPHLVRKLRSTPLPPPLYHWLLLARQPDPTTRKAVLAYLRRQQREESLYYLLLNLGIGGPGGGPSVTAALLRYLVHPSERVSNTALWALGRLRDRSVAPRLRA